MINKIYKNIIMRKKIYPNVQKLKKNFLIFI